MQRTVFLYLFLLSVLINVFTYSYFRGQINFSETRADKRVDRARDSTMLMYNKWVDEVQFSLEGNSLAQDYFFPIDYTEVQAKVPAFIESFNDDPEGNKLVPYEKMNDAKFVINKVKLLNHRWGIANFSNGEIWGELLFKYFITEEGEISIERIDSQVFASK